jgi:hypothetical protein
VLAAAVTIHEPIPSGVYRYVQTISGQTAEKTTITVKRRAGEIIISDTTNGSHSGDAFSSSDTMVLGPDLAPRRYAGWIRVRGRTSTATVTIRATSAVAVGTATHGQPRTFTPLPMTQHLVLIAPPLFGGLFALPAQLNAWHASAVTVVRASFGDARILSTAREALLPRPPEVPKRDRDFSIAGPDAATVWYDPATLVVDEIVVPSRHAVIARHFEFA